MSLISGEKKASVGAASRQGQATQATSLQQKQQQQQQKQKQPDNAVETFRKSYLSSGKFNFETIHLLTTGGAAARGKRLCCRPHPRN